MKKRRCVVVGGAPVNEPERIKALFCEDDYFVYCDSGLYHAEKLGKAPDLIVGDFDSHDKPETDTETIVLPHEKDDTDTVFAVKEALKRGFDEFLLVGVIGGRLDHTLGNVAILLYLHSLGIKAEAADDFSLMCIVSGQPEYVSKEFSYFSLLNISGQAEGVTVKGAEYELHDAEITCEYPYGVSNEVRGEYAVITVKKGRLLLIKDY